MMYITIMLISVTIASFSQILLKKSAMKIYDSRIREYLNIYVICGYGLLAVSMILTMYAYTGLDFKNGPVIESLGNILVPVMSWIAFKEKIGSKKRMGILLIMAGVLVFYI